MMLTTANVLDFDLSVRSVVRPSALGEIIRREMVRRDWSFARVEDEMRKRTQGHPEARPIRQGGIHKHTTPIADGEYRTVERPTLVAYSLTFGIPLDELKRAELKDAGWQTFAGEPGEAFAVLADTADDLPDDLREELRDRMRELWREIVERAED